MNLLHTARDMLSHPDVYLNPFAARHPVLIYAVLALIVFCETGLVVTPFLPGDTLLFAVGALAARAAGGAGISLPIAVVCLCVAANCGDVTNYAIGRAAGPKVFRRKSFLLNPKHLAEAQAFYDRHGRKTIILARFVPIVRTFAPFVAGVGRMPFGRFISFSVAGGVLWVVAVSLAGYFLGNIPWVKDHFEVVVVAIVVISVLPMAIQAVQSRRRRPDAATVVADVNG